MVIYIYDKNNLKLIAQPEVRFLEKFKENPNLFYPLYDSNSMVYSIDKINNPIIDNKSKELREMTDYELVKSGKLELYDGEYINEKDKSIERIEKPNEWSKWDKVNNKWILDNILVEKIKKDLKSRLLKKLTEVKFNFLNQLIQIEQNGKKYTFENCNMCRDNLLTKITLMKILEQNKVEKVKVINDKGNIEFITLNMNEIKNLLTKIQDIIEIADVSEQTAIVGMDRYTIEQLKTLDVKDFFEI